MNKSILIFTTTFIVALCSIIYELIFSHTLSIVFGNTVVRYSITIGIFLFFLGLGSMSYSYLNKKIGDINLFNIIEVSLFLMGISALFIIFLSDLFISSYVSIYLVYIPLVLIGFLSGLEIPVLSNMSPEKSWSKVLGVDYFGSLVGTILFSLYLLPEFGLINTIFVVSSLNLFILILFNTILKEKKKLTLVYLFILISFIYLIFNNDYSKKFNDFYIKEKISQQFFIKKKDISIIDTFDTEYQNVRFFKANFDKGNVECLMLDGNLQFCSSWVDVYHQNLFEIPFKFFKENEKLNVLILGGGDLIGVKHLLNHQDMINRIDLVDLDTNFLKWTKENLKQYHKDTYKNKLVQIHNEDVYSFLSNTNVKYDLILYDLTALLSDKQLYINSKEFYTFLTNSLKDDGIFVKYSNGEMGFKLEDCENTTLKERAEITVKNDAIKHIFLNTYKSAGLNYIRYVDGFSVYDHIADDYFNEDYLIMSKTNKRELYLDIKDKYAWKYNKNIDKEWKEIIFKEDLKENSIIYPNYKLLKYRE